VRARPWREEPPRDRLDRWLAGPLRAAGVAYGLGARLHRALYARGLLARRRLGCRVVSVGGLRVGGTAKTPVAAWLAAALHRRGHAVALASRGHGRERPRDLVTLVSDGTHVRSDPAAAGDEAFVLVAHAPGVPVLVGRDRAVVGCHAEAVLGTEVLVLDDGFQHHGLARDVDLVTIDATASLAAARVLPAGPLREPPGALARADALLVVDGPVAAVDEARLARCRAPERRFAVSRRTIDWRPLAGGSAAPMASLAGREVGLLSGIGRPQAFRRSVEAAGVVVVDEERHPDHHRYRESDLAGLDRGHPWLTTEKDAGKILPRWCEGLDLRVVTLGIEVPEEAALLGWLEERLRGGPERD